MFGAGIADDRERCALGPFGPGRYGTWNTAVPKARCELTADEVVELHKQLDLRLSQIGIATQPAVAARIVELVADPAAQVQDYSKAIRTDPALTGRLLRLVNSAFFAQTQPVTSLDRACTLLGIERLRSFALGFYLSRTATTDPSERYSRRVWGESVMRACLASELARRLFPILTSEAFVVGLMLDAGLPLMSRLVGPAFDAIAGRDEPPTRQFVLEFRSLPFTHVDVIKVLATRWKLPDLLMRPLEWHHTAPGDSARTDRVYRLQRVAYYVGAVRLDPQSGDPTETAPLSTIAGRVLGVDTAGLESSVKKAIGEYRSSLSVFGDVAEGIDSPEDLSLRVHQQLVEVMESAIEGALRAESKAAPRLSIGGFTIELAAQSDGKATASIIDSNGNALLTHRFERAGASAETIAHAMGLEAATPTELQQFGEGVRAIAA